MSPVAPPNRTIADSIKAVVAQRHSRPEDRVLYMDLQGKVQLDLPVNGLKPAQIRAAKSDLFGGEDGLSAVVHLSIMIHGSARFTVVEVFDDPTRPTFHALVSIYGEDGKATHRWVPAPAAAIDRWAEVWDGEEEQQDR